MCIKNSASIHLYAWRRWTTDHDTDSRTKLWANKCEKSLWHTLNYVLWCAVVRKHRCGQYVTTALNCWAIFFCLTRYISAHLIETHWTAFFMFSYIPDRVHLLKCFKRKLSFNVPRSILYLYQFQYFHVNCRASVYLYCYEFALKSLLITVNLYSFSTI